MTSAPNTFDYLSTKELRAYCAGLRHALECGTDVRDELAAADRALAARLTAERENRERRAELREAGYSIAQARQIAHDERMMGDR